MKRVLSTVLTTSTLLLGNPNTTTSHIPLNLNLIEHLSPNITTKELEVIDTTIIPHYEFYDSTYEQRIFLATHSHSGVVVDLAYYTLDGEWIEDIHKANPPKSSYISKKAFDPQSGILLYSKASETGTGASTIKTEEKRISYYNDRGQIDSVKSLINWSQGLTAYEINQNSIYTYDEDVPTKLLSISAQRDDTLYEESYAYSDTSDFTKITVEKVYTYGDSTWYERLHPIIKYCRPNDTTTIEYRSEDGGKDSHDLRTYNDLGQLIEETNLNPSTDKVHAKKTYTYNSEGQLLQFRLYRPNSNGELELTEGDNYDYSWKPLSVIESSPFAHSSTVGRFQVRKNRLILELPHAVHTGEIVIVDAAGRIVRQCAISKSHTTLPLSGLANGVYVATLKIENNTQNSFRFIK